MSKYKTIELGKCKATLIDEKGKETVREIDNVKMIIKKGGWRKCFVRLGKHLMKIAKQIKK